MLNPATQPQDQMNEFTHAVWLLKGRKEVRLRNGELVRPVFIPAEDDTCEDCFGTDDYRWNLDGTSCVNRRYDMMEILA